MKLSPELRNKLVTEIRYAAEGMKKSEIITDKMYYFSAVYGMLDRVFNFEYDPELVFAHQVIRQAFETINSKVVLVMQGHVSASASIPNNLFPRLQEDIDEFANKIEKDQKTYSILEDIANIGYVGTGNGSYLHIKGILKV